MTEPDALTAPSLGEARHGFFLRSGGVSRGIYESLNCGPGSADEPEAVAENRARVAAWIGVSPERLLTARQAHTARAVLVDEPWEGPAPEADALVTRRSDVAVAALAADCAPVLMIDPVAQVAAAAHAGWRGAIGGVVEAALETMETAGARRDRVRAAVGPCAGPDAYEVGEEFEARFLEEDPGNARHFRARPGQRPLFDLPGYVVARLARAGVPGAGSLGVCSLTDRRCFSSRRARAAGGDDYGRMISVIRPG